MKNATLVTAFACLTLTSGVLAQSAQVPAPAQSRPVIVENATIHTVTDGVIEDDGYIVFVDGIIEEVGEGEAPDMPNAQRVNAQGLHIFPGLISTETRLGLTETGAVGVTHDYQELGEFVPEVRAAVAINPDSDLIPVTRASGILTAVTFPRGGVISGRPAIIRMDGWTWENMALDTEAGILLNWPRVDPVSSRFRRWRGRGGGDDRVEEQLEQIDRFFDEVEAYIASKKADTNLATDLRYEAMRPVIAGEKPVFIRANSAGQIESAVAWAVERGVKPIILGGEQADEAIPVLARHSVPVIISGTHNLPARRDDPYDDPFTVPKKLYEAGVKFAIASGAETPHERELNHSAATAAAYGLPKEEALRAVTQSAAEILGLGDTLGSIEPGKAATFIITTGDPLEIVNDTLAAFIDGRNIDLGSRHKRLYAKYLEKYHQLGLIEKETDPATLETLDTDMETETGTGSE